MYHSSVTLNFFPCSENEQHLQFIKTNFLHLCHESPIPLFFNQKSKQIPKKDDSVESPCKGTSSGEIADSRSVLNQSVRAKEWLNEKTIKKLQVFLSCNCWCGADPPENCHLTVKNLPKT